MSNGTSAWGATAPAFSFDYDGQSSAALLPTWEQTSTDTAANERRIRYNDPTTRLAVTAQVRTFPDSPAVEWVLEFANKGTADTPIIESILPLDLRLERAAGEQVVLHYANGSKCVIDDFLPQTAAIEAGTPITLAPNGGRSSDGVLPFMNLQWPGGGCILAVGWSGQWASTFERDADAVRLSAGLERTHLRLHPGEQIRTPRILLLPWEGNDPDTGNNQLRQLLLNHYCPRIDGELVIPPVAHMTMSTFHRTAWTDEANELDAIKHAAALGVETFWVDACWYGEGRKWYEEVGSWVMRTDEFPRGLKPVSDAAHAAGMNFVLWVEPERVRAGTIIEREHPEFLLRSDATPENALLNLGLPEAREYVTEMLAGIIESAGVDIYRQDFNMQPLAYWHAADAPDRVGMTETRFIEGLYAVWDELRRRFPRLAIDNCASGGRRIDLETTTRAFPLWRSDFSDVGGPEHGNLLQIGDQSQTAGLSRWVPLHCAAAWSFTPYDWRSAMSTGAVLYCDIRNDQFPAPAATAAIAELKRLRPLFLGDYYLLKPLTLAEDDWCAYQFHRSAEGDGMAVFLRRHASANSGLAVTLRDIDEEAEYEVGFAETFDEPPYTRMSGAALAHLQVTVSDQPGSVLVVYRRITDA